MLQRAAVSLPRRVISLLCVAGSILVAGFLVWAHLAPAGPVQGHSRIDPASSSTARDVVLLSDSSLGLASNFERVARDFVAAGALAAESITVDGYINDVQHRRLGSILQSLEPDAQVDLVLVNVGESDIWTTRTDIRQTVGGAIDRLRQVYPRARLVLIGPADVESPREPERTGAIDVAISRAAASRGVEFVSVIAEKWHLSGSNGALTASGGADLSNRILDVLGQRESSMTVDRCESTTDLRRVVCYASGAGGASQ